jgi:hypothetical protein
MGSADERPQGPSRGNSYGEDLANLAETPGESANKQQGRIEEMRGEENIEYGRDEIGDGR